MPDLVSTPVMRLADVDAVLGLSRRSRATCLADGLLVRLGRGLVVGRDVAAAAADDPGVAHELSLRCLLLRFPGSAASSESSALVHGLPTLRRPVQPIVTRTRGAWRGGDGSRVRVAPLPPDHLTAVRGMCTTSEPRAVVDVSRTGPLAGAFVVGDAFLRRGLPRSALTAMVEECAAWADVGKARHAIDLLDGRAESPLESASRAVFVEHELDPLPEPQVPLVLDVVTSYRADFCWRQHHVIGEADGLGKYDEPGVLVAEKLRQERLEQAGYAVVRWSWAEILGQTDVTLQRIHNVLVRAAERHGLPTPRPPLLTTDLRRRARDTPSNP